MFCPAGKEIRPPVIKWGNTTINHSDTIKYIGLTIDRKRWWIAHGLELRKKAMEIGGRAMAITRRVWGTDKTILKRAYLQGIRPIFLYGAEIWGVRGADSRLIRHLSATQRPFLLAISGCYKTTATESMEILLNIEPLWLKAKELHLLQQLKKQLPYEIKTSTEEKSPPWRRGKLKFTLVTEGTLGGPEHTAIYTDDSKSAAGTGAGVVIFNEPQDTTTIQTALPETTSVFQAELFSIREAMLWISNNGQTIKIYHIYSDSRSALQAIVGLEQQNRTALQIYKLACHLQGKGLCIKLFWIKAHAGHVGNEAADQAAKEAGTKPVTVSVQPSITVLKNRARTNTKQEWTNLWRQSTKGRKLFHYCAEPIGKHLELGRKTLLLLT